MKIEIGSEWVSDSDGSMEFLVLEVGNTDDCPVKYEVYINGHYMGKSESNKYTFLLSKSPIISIQEQAYDEGYDQAIDDLIEAGVIGEDEEDYLDEEYSEYEFGAAEDEEEEYCFSKELDRILNNPFVVDTKPASNNKEDLVNNPTHYNSDPSGVQCIEITRHRNNNIGNVIKYVWRNGLKDGNSNIQDLEKAAWYLNDEIQRLKDIEE